MIEVEARIEDDRALPPLTFYMPVWTPGSYLVREFARHVEGLTASTEHGAAKARKVRKNAWRVEPNGARGLVVRYKLWANDLSVRTNHVDATHAFLNGAATFLALEGHEEEACSVEIEAPPEWRVSTSLVASAPDVRRFQAADFHDLVDAPLEIGTHETEPFELLGKPHAIVVWPAGVSSAQDRTKLARDLRTILDTQAGLFESELPYDRYVVLLHLCSRGRGGLEHASSAALLASVTSFATREAYLDLLSLVAHEAFHVWNVKRIRPAAFTPYRYEGESYTRLLWWFEGGTSYYDYLSLRRARICSVAEYLDHLAAEIAYVEATPGRLVQTLAEASFDAWIKLYRPDENTANSSVSYYRKGEIVCALLDIEIRTRSDGRKSLDDVARMLWTEHGKTGIPVEEDALELLFQRATGVDLSDFFDRWLRTAAEIDCDATLAHVGLRVERSTRHDAKASLGLRSRADGPRTLVTAVPRGGGAQRAGIDVGDELIAIGDKRIEAGGVEAALAGKRAGEAVPVLIAKDGRTMTREVTLEPPRADRVKLVLRTDASPEARARFEGWLGEPHPSWEKK